MGGKKFKRILIILLVSFILQLIAILLLKTPAYKDGTFYDSVALNLSAGKGFSADGVTPITCDIKQGYVLFLALIYKIFGRSLFLVKIIQAILMSLTCIITYRIGVKLFNEQVGYCCALVAAIHPAFVFAANQVISESLFTFILALSILFLVMAMEKKSLRLYIVSGIFLGISVQVRFTPAFFPFFIYGGLLFYYNKEKLYALKASIIILLAVIIIALPWTVRNYIHFGYINPLTEYWGVLWLGSYTKGSGHQDNIDLQDEAVRIYERLNTRFSKDEIGTGKYEVAHQRLLFKLSLQNVKEDPLGYFGLFPKKIFRLWISSYSNLSMFNITFADFMHNKNLIKFHPLALSYKLFALLFSLLVFCFGIIGMIVNYKSWKRLLPLYLIVSYFTLLHMVVFADTRVGMPAVPYMIILAVSAVFWASQKSRKAGI